ncbi:MAG TPA: type I DNA topoisomerase, partial [Acidobacteriota bacterium]|nr:type I DNA topoisomerase [Acidobacteriota bacterium]
EEYWTLDARLAAASPPEFKARARLLDGKKWDIADRESSDRIVEELGKASFIVQKIHRREKKRYPVPPFITSKLQQEAARKLNFSVKRTMTLAQKLYEGIETGREGLTGLITYTRTDSSRVAESALQEVRELIGREYGKEYLPHHPIYYKSRKTAQQAHEAIRPTSVERTPESLRNDLEPDMWKLYALIWNRFVASQMNPALFDQTDVTIQAGRIEFKATGSVRKFSGFLAVYQESKPEAPNGAGQEDDDLILPEMKEGEMLSLRELLPAQHFTQPPPRYNEASLVKALESKGIGRPSTYASILSTIQDREYVDKNEGRFYPTEIGEVVLDLLISSFRELFDYEYTATMETHLDRIESGREFWKEAIGDFYKRFSSQLDIASREMRDIKTEAIETDELCKKCGGRMVIKWGKFGRFMACSSYPECKNTKQLAKTGTSDEPEKAQTEEILCEKCGRAMVLKKGRFGEFMACSGYPECKNTKKIVKSAEHIHVRQDIPLEEDCPVCGKKLAIKHGRFGEFTACSNYPECKHIKLKSTGVRCAREGCTGEIVDRKSRRGKAFYGCSNYPDCDFVLWNRPLPEPCSICGAPFLLTRTTKKTGTVRFCAADDCTYKESVDSD